MDAAFKEQMMGLKITLKYMSDKDRIEFDKEGVALFIALLEEVNKIDNRNKSMREAIEMFLALEAAPKGSLATVGNNTKILRDALKYTEAA